MSSPLRLNYSSFASDTSGDSPAPASRTKRAKVENHEDAAAPLAGGTELPAPLQKTGHKSMPYLGCNEEKQADMLGLLTETSQIAPDRRVHLGFSVWFNLDLMSVTKPAYGIICDINDCVIDIYSGIQKCLAMSDDALTFVNNFRSFLIENSEDFFAGLPGDEIKKLFDIDAELVRPGSWLQSPEKFHVIKSLHENGRIRYLNLNIADETGIFDQIGSWMQRNNLELDTLYASNIVEWLKSPALRASYVKNLQRVSSNNTRFMQAYIPKLYVRGACPALELGIGAASVRIPAQKPLEAMRSSPIHLAATRLQPAAQRGIHINFGK
ncbi:MAG TPA: hypothetical protein VIJ46_05070 [Rhabdochlamydiaceae bacterium]